MALRTLAEAAGVSHTSIDKAERGGSMRDSTLWMVVVALAGKEATQEQKEALMQEARAVKAGLPPPAKQEGLTITDAGGRTWSVVARLGDPTSPFVLSPEAAKVLAAIGVLGEPREPPAIPGDEGIDTEGEARA